MKSLTLFLLLLASMSAMNVIADNNELADTDLAPMSSPDFDGFYLASTFSVPTAKQVFVEDVIVEFEDGWLRDYRSKTSSHYQKRIKTKYGTALKDQLIEMLEASGWQVQDTKSAKTLILSPKIVELNIYAPNEPGIRQVIVRNAGHAKMELTFRSPNGTPFMRIEDRRITRENIGSPIVANMASNYRYFKILMGNWAEKSVIYLNSINEIVKQQAAK